MVLRSSSPLQAEPQLEHLRRLGVRHVEIAWQAGPLWVEEMAALLGRFPDLELGAASVCEIEAVDAAATAGCRYAVSPVLDPALLGAAAERDLVLVPGVMTASEVHSARRLGCAIVKLFPGGERRHRPLAAPTGAPGPSASLLHRRRRPGTGGCGALAGGGGGCGGAGLGAGRAAGGSGGRRRRVAGAAGGVGLPLLLKLLRVMGDCLGFDSFLKRSAGMPGGCNA